MRRQLLLAAVLLGCLFPVSQGFGQQLIRQSIGTIGGSNTQGSHYLASSIGQTYNVSPDYSSASYTPGFIQPHRIIINPAKKTIDFAVFPNPSNNMITVSTSVPDLILIMQVRDITGKLVYENTAISDQIQIDCSEWAKGPYFISLSGSNYRTTTSKLIVY